MSALSVEEMQSLLQQANGQEVTQVCDQQRAARTGRSDHTGALTYPFLLFFLFLSSTAET